MVGYDGSESSARALEVAADLVGYGSTLDVVTIRATELDEVIPADARDLLGQRLVEAGYHEATGEPAKQLVKKAHELRADLLVIGRRHGDPPLGSVSSKVVRRAHCDVLVVS
jgi:nucleotide-binding universal stress UspA family protein